jgi:ProP effector
MHDPTAQPDDDHGLPAIGASPATLASDSVAGAGSGDDESPALDIPPTPTIEAEPVGESGPGVAFGDGDGDGADADADAAVRDESDPASAPAALPTAIPELSPAACAARLAALFPALFKGPPKPLKLRIQADIQQRAPGNFTRRTLSAFLHRHTTTTAYLVTLSQAKERFDLDGAPAGELADEHRQAAVAELARRRALHEERRAAENAARRAAEIEARQAHAAADQARRERALVLRAFETSTLTRANFCALKRIDEAALDALLATARQEAAQAAQASFDPRPNRPADIARPPQPPGEHRPGGERRDSRGNRDNRDPRSRPGGLRPDAGPRRPTPGKPPR